MTLVSKTLTLSRWHHAADRIRAVADAKHQRALSALGHTTISQPLSPEQIEALGRRGEQALELIKEAMEALGCVGTIRKELARANAEHGITPLLAEAEVMRRQARMLASYTDIDLVTRTPLTNVNSALKNQPSNGNDIFSTRSGGVEVALVQVDALEFSHTQRALLEAQVAGLMDKVAEINRTTLTLSLPHKLAGEIGL